MRLFNDSRRRNVGVQVANSRLSRQTFRRRTDEILVPSMLISDVSDSTHRTLGWSRQNEHHVIAKARTSHIGFSSFINGLVIEIYFALTRRSGEGPEAEFAIEAEFPEND